MPKPYSEACERNGPPILSVLKRQMADARRVLEIGSGTGQHAAYFAPRLQHLRWLPSDVPAHLPGIREWVEGIANVEEPIALDVDVPWPAVRADAAFSANTTHIMSWPQVERMFTGLAGMTGLKTFSLYGPFNYGGKPTSESNARFDAMLRVRDPLSGLRDIEAVTALALAGGFSLEEDHAMPANNRLLAFRR
jgi:hypothetical protein